VNGKLDISAFRRVAALNSVVFPVLVLPMMPMVTRQSPSPEAHWFFQKIKLATILAKTLRLFCQGADRNRDCIMRAFVASEFVVLGEV
jgi:hypothetical protein